MRYRIQLFQAAPAPRWLLLSAGAFLSGGLAAASAHAIYQSTYQAEGRCNYRINVLIFNFAFGLFMLFAMAHRDEYRDDHVGQCVGVTPSDIVQLALIGSISLAILLVKWKDLNCGFFLMKTMRVPLELIQ